MKNYLFIVLCAVGQVAMGATLIPSELDPTLNEVKEKVFMPWSTPEEASVFWKKLGGSNIPIYCERRPGKLIRDIYVPNPGIGYWVLGDLSETAFWKTQEERVKIGDELVSAIVYKNERGIPLYWALWVPKDRSYLIKDKMLELGITPARIAL